MITHHQAFREKNKEHASCTGIEKVVGFDGFWYTIVIKNICAHIIRIPRRKEVFAFYHRNKVQTILVFVFSSITTLMMMQWTVEHCLRRLIICYIYLLSSALTEANPAKEQLDGDGDDDDEAETSSRFPCSTKLVSSIPVYTLGKEFDNLVSNSTFMMITIMVKWNLCTCWLCHQNSISSSCIFL